MAAANRKTVVLLVVAGLGLLLGLPFLVPTTSHQDLHGLQPNTPAPDFALTDRVDKHNTLASYADKPLYLSFGYRHCSETCPTQLATLKKLSEQLGDKAHYLWISLDPEADKALAPLTEQLAFPQLQEGFTDPATIDQLAAKYLGSVVRHSDSGPNNIAHSSYIYLVDPKGTLTLLYQGTQVTADMMVADLKQLNLLH